MKNLRLILSLLVLTVGFALGQTLTVLKKGDSIVAQTDQTIVMDKYTFGKYAYMADKCDTLKQKIKEYDSIVVVRDSFYQRVVSDYKILVQKTEVEKNVYRAGLDDITKTLNQSIDRNNKLQIDYKKLEHRNKRIKRWRNIFMGSSLGFATVILLIVVL